MTEREKLVYFIKNAKAAYQSKGNILMSEEEFIADRLIEYDVMSVPFAIGDTVYVDGDTWGTGDRLKTTTIRSKEFIIAEITSVINTGRIVYLMIKGYYKNGGKVLYKRYRASSIGKTVFLDKEQIEKALAERNSR